MKIKAVGMDEISFENLIEPDTQVIGVIITDNDDVITKVNELAFQWTGLSEGEIINSNILHNKYIKSRRNMILEVKQIHENDDVIIYVLFVIDGADQLNKLNGIVNEYQSALESFYDDIMVTDGEGVVLRAGKFNEQICGLKTEDIEGKSVFSLEKEGIMCPSATVKVLKTRQKVTVLQITNLERKLLVTSFPVFETGGTISRVISFSRDITEEDLLAKRLREQRDYMKYYNQQHELLSRERLNEFSMIGESQRIKRVEKMIIKAAAVSSNVLILGESGVGKELVAKNIHSLSERRNGPFVTINCGAIPENLIEAELFGYGKGAFTGASSSGKLGQIDMANGGTLFLDEIGDMPLHLQVKILDVIQNKRYKRIGEVSDRNLDVRIIAATNRNLLSMVKGNRFRLDLYYRLNVITITVPPLRKREKDIMLLSNYFLDRYCAMYGKKVEFSEAVLDILNHYSWPGNVRELENVTEGLVVMMDDDSVIEDKDVIELLNDEELLLEDDKEEQGVKVHQLVPLKDAIADMEEQLFSMAMKQFKTAQASAEFLGVHQSTLSRKLQRLSRNKR